MKDSTEMATLVMGGKGLRGDVRYGGKGEVGGESSDKQCILQFINKELITSTCDL